MTPTPEALKKKIEELKKQVAEQRKAGDPMKNPAHRKVLKQLKRAQRRLTLMTPVSLEDRQKRTQKQSDLIGKILSDITKAMKKTEGSSRVHSLRKKTKSLNKRLKKLGRLIEKKKASAPAAPPAEATAPAAAAQPEAPKT